MADSVGMADLRAENVDRIVKGFALKNYVFKQLVMVNSSNSWKETYYKESKADLTGGTGSAVEGVPRMSQFPYGQVTWTETSQRHKKHGMDGEISWEDARTNEIDVIARTLLRIARAITKSVDADIWDTLSEDQSANDVNSHSISAGDEWDSTTVANRDPIQDILDSQKMISIDNYNPYNNGFLALNPTDFSNILGNANVRNSGQFWSGEVTKNGRVGKLCGLDMVVSNNVTDDYAMVGVKQMCGTWKAAHPLSTKVIEDYGIKYTIRAWEVGMCQLTNPEAITLIDNTQE